MYAKTDYMRRLNKYAKCSLSAREESAFLTLAVAPKICGVEEEMCQFMDHHPDATLLQLHTYLESLCKDE